MYIPVDPLHQYEDLLPGPVGSGLAVHYSVSEQLLQALHVCDKIKAGKSSEFH